MKYFKIIIVLAIIIILFFFFFKNVDFASVAQKLKSINPIYPLVFIVGTFFQFIIRAYRWGILLQPIKKNIPLKSLYNYTIIGFFLNIIPGGRVGEAAKGILLAKEENIKKSSALASVVLERIMDILTMILLLLISIHFISNNQAPFLLKLKNISLILLFIIIFVIAGFYLINSKRVFLWTEKIIRFITRIAPLKIRERIISFCINFIKSLKLDLGLVQFLKLFGVSMVIWLTIIPFYWFLMKGFNINIDFIQTIPYYGTIIVAASIPTPGMVGTLDAGSKISLMKLFNVSSETAVAYTLVFHFLVLACTIILGLIAIWKYGLNLNFIKNIKKTDEMS